MKIIKFQNEEEWMQARKGKITGTRLKNIILKRGTKPKLGFYELISEKLAVSADDENAMERGKRLENEAIELLEKELNKKFIKDLVIWQREDNENIAISPDAYDKNETEAVEIKCLASARHVEALLTKEIPSEYKEQSLQYFIVNDKLKKLYFCFYDPRMSVKQFFYLFIERVEVEDEIKEKLEYEKNMLKDVAKIINALTF